MEEKSEFDILRVPRPQSLSEVENSAVSKGWLCTVCRTTNKHNDKLCVVCDESPDCTAGNNDFAVTFSKEGEESTTVYLEKGDTIIFDKGRLFVVKKINENGSVDALELLHKDKERVGALAMLPCEYKSDQFLRGKMFTLTKNCKALPLKKHTE